ncbi:transglutaminase-like domain-containing protein [Ruminiclostridium cellulolyticum]|uniref:Transglutaminase domain protein n=1 Tax=Ruminiclostridium cellulolyticum (strain ATCC 35319 / DSM 5812 / JCM 6584 / H10) TaxID=394503 RepID=B8I6Y2_RUMCH|nr:transglutaminase-like domain-containing protein [Ruminiclostridium cellulolyticum]ACL76974.1 transglutaminase domain protein [Ruminiclostridium cellulolyticum H10]
MKDSQQYYKEPGLFTNISSHNYVIENIANNPEYICQIVQGLIVHGAWTKLYGIPSDSEKESYPLYLSDLLTKILNLDTRSILIPRLPEDRVIASCREFATLACAILRAKGIPARCRCGFAVYLGYQGSLEDHWVVEYWNGCKWIMNDPQIDPFQLSMLYKWELNKVTLKNEKIINSDFPNPHNISLESDFIVAGKAWQLCRNGLFDPMKCGIEDLWGLWFVRGQLLRDFAALNKIETTPHLCRPDLDWDTWRLLTANDSELDEADFLLLDKIASLSLDADNNLGTIIETYECNVSLQVPKRILESR